MPTPTCAEDCDFTLPVVSFDDCSPDVAFSEIRRIFIAKKAAVAFSNWLSPTEWLARLSETSTTGNDYIRPLTVIGDKPAATPVTKVISNNRTITVGKDHVINYTIDDISQENYDFMRALECGGQFRFWFETAGGYIYGGNSGFLARISGDIILNRGVDETESIAGAITWRTKFSPERGVSPIFDGDSGGAIPATFDKSLTFAASTTDTDTGVTGTVAANDPDQVFYFNGISPRTGDPASMSIEVGGVEEITIDFTEDYLNQYFKYKDKAGVEHTGGQFVDGTVSF